MKPRALVGVLLLALLGAGLWWLSQRADSNRTAETTAEVAAAHAALSSGSSLGGPSTCLPCHASVVAEWQESMHSRAFTDPQVRAPDQSDNFQKQECLPCHASRPIFEHGIEKDSRVLARVERRFDGIDCLSCHALAGGGVAASSSGLTAPCRPELRPELSTQQMCAACHNQHNTHDEWRASPAATAGKDCLDCHMERVMRGGTEAGAPRGGRSHRFLGGRDRDFALAGLAVTATPSADGSSLHVQIDNRFAGHNLPTDSRNRALDLVVTLLDPRGVPVPAPAGEKREPGCETGTARLRFRNPYRASGDPSTQIPAGTSAQLDVPLTGNVASATVEIFYKLSPWVPDKEAAWSDKQVIALR